MTMAPEAILEELDGQRFDSYRILEECVVELFNRHLAEFPPNYSYKELLKWGTQNDLIAYDAGGNVYVVNVKYRDRSDR
jgi:hypothetical protein